MYSELCEKLFEQNANNYIALFNELDKHFDTLADSEKFMPFNEKVKYISQGDTPMALFVRKYELRLKYFGELRNHIAHGFKLDGKHYAIPSYHALDELSKVKDAIMKPITCGSIFAKHVYTCRTSDTLQEVMQQMKNFNYTHVPVYNDQKAFQGLLTQSTISERLAQHLGDQPVHTADAIPMSFIDLSLGAERFERVDMAKPLFALPLMFEQHMMNQKRLGALLMTEHGDAGEEIVGIITTFDLPMITESTFSA